MQKFQFHNSQEFFGFSTIPMIGPYGLKDRKQQDYNNRQKKGLTTTIMHLFSATAPQQPTNPMTRVMVPAMITSDAAVKKL